MRTFLPLLPTAILSLLISAAAAQPAATSFTYQGRLTSTSAPASGQYDLQFRLYDAAAGGQQLGAVQQLTSHTITDGLLTATLNFGNHFDTQPRWLEIAIRPAGSSTSYTTLAPRQPLAGSPYSLGLILPVSARASVDGDAMRISNTSEDVAARGLFVEGAIGIWGSSPVANGSGIVGSAQNEGTGIIGSGLIGIRGSSSAPGPSGVGVLAIGQSWVALRAESTQGSAGSYGAYIASSASGGTGLFAEANNGATPFAIWGRTNAPTGYAGYFTGNVHVAGNLSKSAGSFKIDHPLDPANKYLYHSFVESPDMMNIYNGNATFDARGMVTISMPQWFEALNTDFRYQLSALDAPSPGMFIAQRMNRGAFTIAGGTPGAGVSWQVTGIRNDPYAQQHRIPVEVDKRPDERGLYIHPHLYGLPSSASLDSRKQRPSPLPQDLQGR